MIVEINSPVEGPKILWRSTTKAIVGQLEHEYKILATAYKRLAAQKVSIMHYYKKRVLQLRQKNAASQTTIAKLNCDKRAATKEARQAIREEKRRQSREAIERYLVTAPVIRAAERYLTKEITDIPAIKQANIDRFYAEVKYGATLIKLTKDAKEKEILMAQYDVSALLIKFHLKKTDFTVLKTRLKV